MSSGFRTVIGGVEKDFDDLFDPDIVGDGPRTDVCFDAAGVGLKYAAIKYGTKGPDVGYRKDGQPDISNLWAAKGTANYALPIDGVTYFAGESVPMQSQGSAQLLLRLKADGTYEVVKSTSHNGSGTLASGTWNIFGGAASSYQVLFTITNVGGTGPGTITNGAATWSSLSSDRFASVSLGPYGPSSGSHDAIDQVRVQIRRASDGVILSDSTCTFSVSVDGSV